MKGYSFGSLEHEPPTLSGYYGAMSLATRRVNAVRYTVPAGLQTEVVARLIIGSANGPELTDKRTATRMRREDVLAEERVRLTEITTEAALQRLHVAGRQVMMAQLNSIQTAVEADIEAGPDSLLQVRIIPATIVPPLPQELPNGIYIPDGNDFTRIDTNDGVFISGGDGVEVDRLGSAGERGREAQRRNEILGYLATEEVSVTGLDALALIEQSRAYIPAA